MGGLGASRIPRPDGASYVAYQALRLPALSRRQALFSVGGNRRQALFLEMPGEPVHLFRPMSEILDEALPNRVCKFITSPVGLGGIERDQNA